MNNENKATVLTLEHLAPYLPYKLKLLYVDRSIRELLYLDVSGIIPVFKPILRPLSDLTKEIEHNGERFVPIVELFKLRTQSTGNEIFDYYIENDTAILRLKSQHLDDLTFKCFFEVDLEPGQVSFSIASETWDDFGSGKMIDERIDMCGNEMMMFNKLYSWHFDLASLIGSRLAIDINSIEGKETNNE